MLHLRKACFDGNIPSAMNGMHTKAEADSEIPDRGRIIPLHIFGSVQKQKRTPSFKIRSPSDPGLSSAYPAPVQASGAAAATAAVRGWDGIHQSKSN